jgi:hypothetical protein
VTDTARPRARRAVFRWAAAGALAALLATPGFGYVLIRIQSFTAPPASWPIANLPLPMRINPAGSDNIPDNTDIDAIVAGQASWNVINTSYFQFATPTVAGGTALNSVDGINSVFFDETGTIFGAGSSALAATFLNINGATGVISDADLVFNGTYTFSTATPTPVGTYDIETIAAHELGHVTGLDHTPIVVASMFPVANDGSQAGRVLTSDDRLAESFVYPESESGAGIAGLQAGDGDLDSATGRISGFARTSIGLPVPGAHVMALDTHGRPVVGDLSRNDGSYLLTGLAPGSYTVLAEPADGFFIEQDVSQGGHSNAFTRFEATYLGGNPTPTVVPVAAGGVVPDQNFDLGSLYGAESEANNTSGTADPVGAPSLTAGMVNPGGDLDWFSFFAFSGDYVVLDLDGSGDGVPLDPLLRLYSTDGSTLLRQDDDFDGKGNDSRIAWRFTANGTYFVRVSDFGGVGSPGSFYTLGVQKAVVETEANNSAATANAASLGEYRGGIVSSSTDFDYYSFLAMPGDRLIAEVTARRSGSLLDPNLTLYAPNGTTVLASNGNISASDVDSRIDYHFQITTPDIFYLRVAATSGSGANSFYVLHLGTDRMNVVYTALTNLGQGVGSPPAWQADVFPKFVPQGSSLDLIAGGVGIPFESSLTLLTPGSGVSFSTSAGPDFGINAQGIDFFAMSMFVSGDAPIGPRVLFVQTSSRQAVLAGGLVITPAGLPGEAAEPGSTLAWQGSQMGWAEDPFTEGWNVYSGPLSLLVDTDANGVSESYGSPFACGLTSPLAADPSVPSLGAGVFYLVAAFNSNGEGTLGFTRSNSGPGPERPKTALTSLCN